MSYLKDEQEGNEDLHKTNFAIELAFLKNIQLLWQSLTECLSPM